MTLIHTYKLQTKKTKKKLQFTQEMHKKREVQRMYQVNLPRTRGTWQKLLESQYRLAGIRAKKRTHHKDSRAKIIPRRRGSWIPPWCYSFINVSPNVARNARVDDDGKSETIDYTISHLIRKTNRFHKKKDIKNIKRGTYSMDPKQQNDVDSDDSSGETPAPHNAPTFLARRQIERKQKKKRHHSMRC